MPHILHSYYKSSKLFFKQQNGFSQFAKFAKPNNRLLLGLLSASAAVSRGWLGKFSAFCAIFDGIEWQSGFQPLMTFNGSAVLNGLLNGRRIIF